MPPLTLPKPMDHLPKQPRRSSGKAGSTRSVTRLRAVLTATAARVNTGLVTVAGYLQQLGADAEFLRRFASPYGKTAKKVYIAEYGQEPPLAGLALVRHRLVRVLAYAEDALPILDKAARTYLRTAALIGA